MSGFLNLDKIACAVTSCPLYIDTPFIAPFFVAADYYPVILTATMWAITLYHYELYFFILSICLSIDWGLNALLQYTIKMPGRYVGCGTKYEMPSFASQHAVFFLTLILTFFVIWKKRVSPYRLFLANFLTIFALLARVYIGINRPSELIIGASVGLVEALILQYIIYLFVYPNIDSILSWKVVNFIGLEDNLCRRYSYLDLKNTHVKRLFKSINTLLVNKINPD